ncbi:hypothetical protein OAK65_05545, partial [Synechococcus sp. AH-551-N17]|nr:hypothetical protein [Synechococcus sp. AH-551-N17]
AGADVAIGGDGDDWISTGDGNDLINQVGNTGSDLINGGSGLDLVIVDGASTDYTETYDLLTNAIELSHRTNNNKLKAINVEQIQYSDVIKDISTDSSLNLFDPIFDETLPRYLKNSINGNTQHEIAYSEYIKSTNGDITFKGVNLITINETGSRPTVRHSFTSSSSQAFNELEYKFSADFNLDGIISQSSLYKYGLIKLSMPNQLNDAILDIPNEEGPILDYKLEYSDLTNRKDINSLFVSLIEEESGTTRYIQFDDSDHDGIFAAQNLDMSHAADGNWKVLTASIDGNRSNTSFTRYESGSGYGDQLNVASQGNYEEFKKETGIDLSKFEFTLINDDPDTITPRINEVLTPDSLKDGQFDIDTEYNQQTSFAIRVTDGDNNQPKGNDGSGFSAFSVTLKNSTTEKFRFLQFIDADGNGTAVSDDLNFGNEDLGQWEVEMAYIYDNVNNSAGFDRNINTSGSGYSSVATNITNTYQDFEEATGVDLENFDFEVISSDAPVGPDSIIPRITDVLTPTEIDDGLLQGSQENLNLTFNIEATDGNDVNPIGNSGSGFNYLNITIGEKNSNSSRYINFSDWDRDGDISEGMLDMTWAASGDWKVTNASIADHGNNSLYGNQYSNGSGYAGAGNQTSLSDFEQRTGIDLSDFEFLLSNPNADSTAPVVTSTIKSQELNDGVLDAATENQVLDFEITVRDSKDSNPNGNDGSGFQNLSITLKELNSDKSKSISFSDWDKDGTIDGGSLDMEWAPNGTWVVDNASISDYANNYIYGNRSNFGGGYSSTNTLSNFETSTGINLSDFEFTLKNSLDDTTAPVVTSTVKPQELNDGVLDAATENQVLDFEITVRDPKDSNPNGNDGSGFQNLSITLKELNSGTSKYLFFSDRDK